ncbi:stalk domain-containing protein [Aneurinibacillus sp. Ricciae_BoGa-3]|uniref:stalk domain-containing protein n=1 Tax=Aneurinibacillus sp. Ricciae_BoGa-3 TaxID=3022697 RepID=UPI002341479D|nr:stalk domain-containing protein [Aneurinibacillus sp. Ricciae_BoGa-3]WCK54874.1 stalk domain-containing protein [Aneurinibacillus sp. Ricciae_BoGa-3]
MQKMMAFLVVVMLVLFVPVISFAKTVQASYMKTSIQINVDGRPVSLRHPVVLTNKGIVMFPARSVLVALRARLSWDPKTNTLTAIKNHTTLRLKVGDNIARWDNDNTMTQQAPFIVNGNLMVQGQLLIDAFTASNEVDLQNKIIHLSTVHSYSNSYNNTL